MENYAAHSPVKWLVTIVDRGKGEKVAKIYRANQLFIHLAVLGNGTARSEVMDLLGLDEPEKDIVLSLIPESHINEIIHELNVKMQFYRPGSGIAFTVPLSGISAAASRQTDCCTTHIQIDREVTRMESKQHFDLIISVINRGQTDLVMDAAKVAGATGGTVVKARGLDSEETEKFLKISLQPEKEIVVIIVPHEIKQAVMKEICKKVLSVTDERGVVFSVPIDDVTGLNTII